VAIPANDAAIHKGTLLNDRAAHNCGVDNLNSTFNHTTFADDDVGANLSSILHYGSLVNNSVVFAFVAELSLSFDVSGLADEVVSRLTYVHPESL
jgi:hypothetical protein